MENTDSKGNNPGIVVINNSIFLWALPTWSLDSCVSRSSLTTCPNVLLAPHLIQVSTLVCCFRAPKHKLFFHPWHSHYLSPTTHLKSFTFFLSTFLIIQVSNTYSTTEKSKAFISFTCVPSLIHFTFHTIVVVSPIASLPVVILLRISSHHIISHLFYHLHNFPIHCHLSNASCRHDVSLYNI